MLLDSVPITEDRVAELRSRIGQKLRLRPFFTTATRDNIAKFVHAIGDPNPLWNDVTYGGNTRYGSIIAPPSFLYGVVCPSGDLAGGLPGVHSFHGGNEWEFYRPIRLGDKISAEAWLSDVREAEGQAGGPMVIQSVDVLYSNQHNELVAKARGWSLRIEREQLSRRKKYASWRPYRYSDEEVKAIEDAYEQEQRQGARVRYWEEVKEGDELAPVVKGPLSLEDVETYMANTHWSDPLAYWVERFRKHPAMAYRDPIIGFVEPVSRVCVYDFVAADVGMPRAYGLGCETIAWLVHLVTNWAGDAGMLSKLRVELRRPVWHGDTQWCKGRVTRKQVEGELHLVDLDLWCESQRHETTARGTATVALLSKSIRKPSFERVRTT